MPTSESIKDFEKSLQELEEIVGKMEQGQLSLEQSLDAFESGVQLTKQCQATLKSAQQRVSILTQAGNSFELKDFQDTSTPEI